VLNLLLERELRLEPMKSTTIRRNIMLKRSAAIVLAIAFLSLAIAPEALACHRNRRASYYRPVASSYYSPYAYSGVAGTRYYSQPYYSGVRRTQYYSQPYYGGVRGSQYYSQPYYRGVAGTRYYGQSYYGDYRRRSTRNLALTVAAPAAIGAGIGAIAGGGKGAGIGALVGGGGGALFYLLKNRSRRY
jgi:hypothetical protein